MGEATRRVVECLLPTVAAPENTLAELGCDVELGKALVAFQRALE